MGRHSIPGEPVGDSADPDDGDTPSGRIARAQGEWTGRRRAIDPGRRGVSVGVIAALVAVVVLVGGVILWRFFGHALSKRSTDAAHQCLAGTAAVAVVADPSIAETVQVMADRYNDEGSPVGDKCVKVTVTPSDSDAVVSGLTGEWQGGLGERPALWIPASSIASARLQAAAGKQIVSDARSLVMSPVALAVRPQLKDALGQQDWASLPRLQSDPVALDANLPGWGALRLALPTAGAADAAYLVAEAVAMASAPPEAPASPQLGAAGALLADQPRLSENTANAAWDALLAPGDPAAAPVHAVAMTEQQLFSRTSALADAKNVVAEWFPSGPVAAADYPTVLLSGDWLAEEQITAASEFARFMRKSDQLSGFAKAGFRIPESDDGAKPEGNDVVGFGPLGAALPVGDDAARAAVAAVVSPIGAARTSIMLNQNLAAAAPALKERIGVLSPAAAVGLWTFNGLESAALVPTGPLADDLGGGPRSAALDGALDSVVAVSGSGGVSFTTLRLVYGDAQANYVPGQPNSILVITQGPHTDRSLDGPGLEEFIRSAIDPNRPVAINVIDVGGDPDRPVWESLAQLSGGSYQDVPAADSPEAAAAIARLLS